MIFEEVAVAAASAAAQQILVMRNFFKLPRGRRPNDFFGGTVNWRILF